MSCNCQKITCIKVFVSPCDTGIDIGLAAGAAGEYTFLLEFNRAYQKFVLTLGAGEDIIIPNCVNGDYTHELQIYAPNGSLFNNTCYALSVSAVVGNGNGLTPAPSPGEWIIIEVTENSTSLTNSFFASHTISEITTQGQSYLVGVDFTQSGDTITGIDISFSIGQILKAEV